MQKIKEWISIQSTKKPRRMIILTILLINFIMIFIGTFMVHWFAQSGAERSDVGQSMFSVINIMLDPGNVPNIVDDVRKTGAILPMIGLIIAIFGMIFFTGAVIGYVSNIIATFIEKSDSETRKVNVSNHFVILNWNTRAAEIINDLLYLEKNQKVVVLTNQSKYEVEKQIKEKIETTIAHERELALDEKKKIYDKKKPVMKNNITWIVREGDVFSYKQLKDISIEKAKTIIILGNDEMSQGKSNSYTIKTLMQVADITASDKSINDQNIIVEVNDEWTMEQVEDIKEFKKNDQKCRITPIDVNKMLGQILSQFTIIPELNNVYSELFSNDGASVYYPQKNHEIRKLDAIDDDTEREIVCDLVKAHTKAIPLVVKTDSDKLRVFYLANKENDIYHEGKLESRSGAIDIKLNPYKDNNDEKNNKTVIILGHNSKYNYIMEGFASYLTEWKDAAEIVVIDIKENITAIEGKYDFIKEENRISIESFGVSEVSDKVIEALKRSKDNVSILILSDTGDNTDDVDAMALSNLIYVQKIISIDKEHNPNNIDCSFMYVDNDMNSDRKKIDVIVELIDPKHHDLVTSYSVDNVVISNKYISRMVTQIGERESLFTFFNDILNYDNDDNEYNSKEIYVRKAASVIKNIPESGINNKAGVIVREFYEEDKSNNLVLHGMLLGTISEHHTEKGGGVKRTVKFFTNQNELVTIKKDDKLIIFAYH